MPLLTLPCQRLTLAILAPEQAELESEFYRRNQRHLAPWSPIRTTEYFSTEQIRRRLEIQASAFEAGLAMHFALLTPDGVFAYPAGASPAQAFDICTDYTGKTPSSNVHGPSLGLSSSAGAVCFVTSDGYLAYAAVGAIEPGSNAATLAVRVWDQKVE